MSLITSSTDDSNSCESPINSPPGLDTSKFSFIDDGESHEPTSSYNYLLSRSTEENSLLPHGPLEPHDRHKPKSCSADNMRMPRIGSSIETESENGKISHSSTSSDVSAPYRIDSYGFTVPDESFGDLQHVIDEYSKRQLHRALRWQKEIPSTYSSMSKNHKMRRFCRKGIPRALRPKIWLFISGAEELRHKSPGLFEYKLNSIDVDAQYLGDIKIDLSRTFPSNIFFSDDFKISKTDSLFHILAAFGANHPDIGYVQGLNYVAAFLLLIMEKEEDAFWMLEALVGSILPKDYYNESMRGLIAEQRVWAEIIRQRMPDLCAKLESLGLDPAILFDKWLISLLVRDLPTETLLRVWDSFLYEGFGILYRTTFALLQIKENFLMECSELTVAMDSLTDSAFASDLEIVHCDQFMKRIFRFQDLPKTQYLKDRRYIVSSLLREEDRVQKRKEMTRPNPTIKIEFSV